MSVKSKKPKTRESIDEMNKLADRLEGSVKKNLNPKQGDETRTEEMLNGQQPPRRVKALNADTKPFSLHNYFRYIRTGDESLAPHEVDCAKRYTKAVRESNCALRDAPVTGHWLPLLGFETYGGQLTAKEEHDRDVRYVKAVFENTRPEFDPDEFEWLRRKRIVKAGQSAFDDETGGSLVAPPTMGEPIPLIRPQAAFMAAGATAMTLPPSGRYVEPRITGYPDVVAVGEGQDTPVDQLTTGQMELSSKKIAGAVLMTEEATAYTSGTMDNIAQSELSRSLGLKIDAYAFYGTGGTHIPHGLTSNQYSGQVINFETAYSSARGLAANGNRLLPEYGDLLPTLIEERSFAMDAGTGAWIMRPSALAYALSLRADAVSADDRAGPQVDIIRRFNEAGQTTWRGRRVVKTTNISNTRSKGASGATLTDAFFGIWQYGIMASYGAVQFQQGHDGNTFLRGQFYIRGTMFGDIGYRYPGAFLWYTNLLGLTSDLF